MNKQRRWPTIVRWLCVLPAAAFSFVVSLVVSVPVDRCIYGLCLYCGLISPGKGYFQFSLPWDGAMTAFFFVLVGAFVAPSNRRMAAFALFILGAFVSLYLFEQLNICSYHLYPDTGQLDMGWSMGGTLTGGALAVACIFAATSRPAVRAA
jgi:hypothetical protein